MDDEDAAVATSDVSYALHGVAQRVTVQYCELQMEASKRNFYLTSTIEKVFNSVANEK